MTVITHHMTFRLQHMEGRRLLGTSSARNQQRQRGSVLWTILRLAALLAASSWIPSAPTRGGYGGCWHLAASAQTVDQTQCTVAIRVCHWFSDKAF